MTKKRKYQITIFGMISILVITSLYLLTCADTNTAPDGGAIGWALAALGMTVTAFCGGNAAEHWSEAKKAIGLDRTTGPK